MARCRRSFVSVLCLSFIFLSITNAHPRSHHQRQALELTIEEWNDAHTSTNTTLVADDTSVDVSQLPKSLKGFLQLLSLGLKLFGDALSSLLDGDVPANATAASPLLTDVPAFGTLVPAISTYSWANTSRVSSTTSVQASITSYLTVKTTRVLTVTASRSALPVASTPPLSIKQATLPFQNRNLVQVYAGRYPGLTRTITDLEALCNSPSIDIITLAGITEYFSNTHPQQAIPKADFDGLCATLPFASGGECSALAGALLTCQRVQGKKVFLAVEAGGERTTLRSAREARTLASLLWDGYGAGKEVGGGARGNNLGVAFDGFEFLVNTTTIDDQYFAAVSKAKRDSDVFVPPTLPYFDVLFDELRGLFLTGDTSKPYYLSVSLPCTRPSILSRTALTLVDFVSVRFMDDVACNINGLAFSNFLTTWGQDIADQSAVDRVSIRPNASTVESTLTLTSTRLRTTTVRSAQAVGTALRLMDPNRFSVLRYTQTETETVSASPTDYDIVLYDSNGSLLTSTGPEPTPLYPVDINNLESMPWLSPSNLEKRQGQTPPFFMLGIPVPSQDIQNATAQSGVGSADPTTLSMIIEHARSAIPKFVGVLLWGGVEDLEVGLEGGYLDFVGGLLDSAGGSGSGSAPPGISSAVVTVVQSRSVVVSNLVELPTAWNEIPTPTPSPRLTSSIFASGSPIPPAPWNEIPTPSPSPRLTSSLFALAALVAPGETSSLSQLSIPMSSLAPSASTSVPELSPLSSSLAGPSSPLVSTTISAESSSIQTVVLASLLPVPSSSSESEENVTILVRSTRLMTRTITRSSSSAFTVEVSSSASSVMEEQFGVR